MKKVNWKALAVSVARCVISLLALLGILFIVSLINSVSPAVSWVVLGGIVALCAVIWTWCDYLRDTTTPERLVADIRPMFVINCHRSSDDECEECEDDEVRANLDEEEEFTEDDEGGMCEEERDEPNT